MLTDPVALGPRTAPSRVLFGPHVTNLAPGRALGPAHVAHYAARAAGGAGVVVTEVASVHDSDHPYAYAPRAADCGPGWSAVVSACRPALVVAGLGHAGAQGSSAHHRRALWAPSRVADPASREVPAVMGPAQEAPVVEGFAAAALLARESGCDGVEIAAGQHALLRQYLSPMTGPGSDELVRAVLVAVRAAIGDDAVLGLRLAVDECAPWAGITPERGVATAAGVAGLVDYLVPVRGSALAVAATRPDARTEPGFLAGPCAAVRSAVAGRCAVVLAGSVVDPSSAEAALADGVADLVEMTRAQLADPTLVAAVRAGRRPRPCTLTNQECRVRDPRNPAVSCTVEPGAPSPGGTNAPFAQLVLPPEVPGPSPATGSRSDTSERTAPHSTPSAPETGISPMGAASSATTATGPSAPRRGAGAGGEVLVIGGGPAGLEGARALALAGHRVRLAERGDELGGTLRTAARLPGRERFALLADWLADEVRRLGVAIELGAEAGIPGDGPVLLATGAVDVPGLSVSAVLGGLPDAAPADPVVIDDPLGDGVAVALAELLAARGHRVSLVTPDPIAGKLTPDVVGANLRLQRAGVARVLEAAIVEAADGVVTVADVDTGARRTLPCAALVDAGPRRAPAVRERPGLVVAGDALAPRTVTAAIREGRRAADGLIAWCGR